MKNGFELLLLTSKQIFAAMNRQKLHNVVNITMKNVHTDPVNGLTN